MAEIEQVLNRLDELFIEADTDKIQNFLEEKISCWYF